MRHLNNIRLQRALVERTCNTHKTCVAHIKAGGSGARVVAAHKTCVAHIKAGGSGARVVAARRTLRRSSKYGRSLARPVVGMQRWGTCQAWWLSCPLLVACYRW